MYKFKLFSCLGYNLLLCDFKSQILKHFFLIYKFSTFSHFFIYMSYMIHVF
jgi:hypothetical protein